MGDINIITSGYLFHAYRPVQLFFHLPVLRRLTMNIRHSHIAAEQPDLEFLRRILRYHCGARRCVCQKKSNREGHEELPGCPEEELDAMTASKSTLSRVSTSPIPDMNYRVLPPRRWGWAQPTTDATSASHADIIYLPHFQGPSQQKTSIIASCRRCWRTPPL